MGYNERGHQLPLPKWNPGSRGDNFPMWIKADGIKAPKCPHDIKFVHATGNEVNSLNFEVEIGLH